MGQGRDIAWRARNDPTRTYPHPMRLPPQGASALQTGVIAKMNSDGSYTVRLDGGGVMPKVPRNLMMIAPTDVSLFVGDQVFRTSPQSSL